MSNGRETVLVTGGSGFIGRALVGKLAAAYNVVGLDLQKPGELPPSAEFEKIDLTSEKNIRDALERIGKRHGRRIASVIHLAAYFDLTGEPNPKYEEITLRGTERLLSVLQDFEVEQFVFASSMLAHRATGPGEKINENTPLEPQLPYRNSKIVTEQAIHEQRGSIPVVYLRPAGVYDDRGSNVFLANQISRIYERDPTARVYPGDLRTGQSYLHLDDLADAVLKLVRQRKDLPTELPLLLGEPEAIGYGELQREIGRLIHGEEWQTWEVPKPLAKAGAWVQTDILGEDTFIRPWMVDIADDHYDLDISRARTLLGWKPKHSLRAALPEMIRALKADPSGWYRINKLNAAKVAGRGGKARARAAGLQARQEKMKSGHMTDMKAMHGHMLWTHCLVIALGAWLLTSPLQFALFDPAGAAMVRDLTLERSLWEPALRNALTGWNDIVCGLLLMLFGALALSPRFAPVQWGTTVVGLWLLFAPLIFWTPSAAAYANDTIVGALAIAFSVLVPMMPGMSHEGMMDESTVPPGWSYSPSSWLQRLPIIALGFFGFLIARYLTAYQMGQIDGIWEPFFSGDAAKNGTEFIITSDVSRAWPIPDAGLGATSYMIEALMGAMGTASRWRTMPWMVTFFFILVVPLGGVSIFFIIIQPIMIGTYCTLCLIAAFAMLIMIPLTLDEVVAMGQYMLRSHRAGQPFWRTFFMGGAEPSGGKDEKDPGFAAPVKSQAIAAVRGVTLPWPLLASCVIGAWLMFSRLIFDTEGAIADSDHLTGAMIITVAVCAMAEVGRPLRFINVLFGLWLIVAPWLLAGAAAGAILNDVVAGLLIIALSLPRGARSNEHYGAWDRFVV
ncbi:DNA polymerase III subunit epsilon [Paramesorhizobium deserti]|uniref:DNA polymerase III subunit epsilon n=1 Tax=Paramesorhizobium deserti TaxID=1494590 RepID=A0A135HZA6_9HYPH|nr:NAD-dependent epimerase/dehydratase family protein [Paramesorhizobium deserti]KXF78501.1 DNA polymerase III subunit epsilon [Paramesorhizobium deserti]